MEQAEEVRPGTLNRTSSIPQLILIILVLNHPSVFTPTRHYQSHNDYSLFPFDSLHCDPSSNVHPVSNPSNPSGSMLWWWWWIPVISYTPALWLYHSLTCCQQLISRRGNKASPELCVTPLVGWLTVAEHAHRGAKRIPWTLILIVMQLRGIAARPFSLRFPC